MLIHVDFVQHFRLYAGSFFLLNVYVWRKFIFSGLIIIIIPVLFLKSRYTYKYKYALHTLQVTIYVP